MSFENMKRALHLPIIEVSPTTKLVAVALADCENAEDFLCFPSTEYLVKITGLSRSSVLRAIKKLEKLEYIAVAHVRNRGNKYCLHGLQQVQIIKNDSAETKQESLKNTPDENSKVPHRDLISITERLNKCHSETRIKKEKRKEKIIFSSVIPPHEEKIKNPENSTSQKQDLTETELSCLEWVKTCPDAFWRNRIEKNARSRKVDFETAFSQYVKTHRSLTEQFLKVQSANDAAKVRENKRQIAKGKAELNQHIWGRYLGSRKQEEKRYNSIAARQERELELCEQREREAEVFESPVIQARTQNSNANSAQNRATVWELMGFANEDEYLANSMTKLNRAGAML